MFSGAAQLLFLQHLHPQLEQQYFQPVRINHDLEVIPYWENRNEAKITIKIKPGMAFGTGHHETTSLVMNRMFEIDFKSTNTSPALFSSKAN